MDSEHAPALHGQAATRHVLSHPQMMDTAVVVFPVPELSSRGPAT